MHDNGGGQEGLLEALDKEEDRRLRRILAAR